MASNFMMNTSTGLSLMNEPVRGAQWQLSGSFAGDTTLVPIFRGLYDMNLTAGYRIAVELGFLNILDPDSLPRS
jgi:hypothetical protein